MLKWHTQQLANEYFPKCDTIAQTIGIVNFIGSLDLTSKWASHITVDVAR